MSTINKLEHVVGNLVYMTSNNTWHVLICVINKQVRTCSGQLGLHGYYQQYLACVDMSTINKLEHVVGNLVYMDTINNTWHVLICVINKQVRICSGQLVYMDTINNTWHVLICVNNKQVRTCSGQLGLHGYYQQYWHVLICVINKQVRICSGQLSLHGY